MVIATVEIKDYASGSIREKGLLARVSAQAFRSSSLCT